MTATVVQPKGDYLGRKRDYIQACNYSYMEGMDMQGALCTHTFDPVLTEQDRALFFSLSEIDRENTALFLHRCCWLGWRSDDPIDDSEGQVEMEQLSRLLSLDHELIGKFAAEQLEHLIARMKRMVRMRSKKQVRLVTNTDKRRVVTLENDTFAQCVAANGWIIIARESLDQETLSAHTMSCVWNFPPPRFRKFVHFARSFGFCRADDRDVFNKTFSLISSVRWFTAGWELIFPRPLSSLVKKDCLGIMERL